MAKSQTHGDMTPSTVHTEREGQARTEETRRRIKETLYAAKADGSLTEEGEAELLAFALTILSRRGEEPGG